MCPGAPFLVEGAATAIARTVPDLLAACRRAVDLLPPADRTVLITSGLIGSGPPTGDAGPEVDDNRGWRIFRPGAVVQTSVTRNDLTDPGRLSLPGGDERGGADHSADHTADHSATDTAAGAAVLPSVATMVGAHLLRAAAHRTPTSALEVIGAGAPSLAADLPPQLSTDGPDRVSLLVIADGAACHGDNAPGRRDDRSGAFDAAIARALAAGDPAALSVACRNPELPADAVMASVGPLAVLADLTHATPPNTAELLYSGAPFGVGLLRRILAMGPGVRPHGAGKTAGHPAPVATDDHNESPLTGTR